MASFILGLFVGAFVGIILMALMIASGDARRFPGK